MNTPNPLVIELTTPTDQFSVIPGNKIEVPLLITNQRTLPDQLRVSVEGIPLVWVSANRQVMLLQSGQQESLTLTINSPTPPNVQIGRYHLFIRVTSLIDPASTAQVKAVLTVAGVEVKGRVGVLLEGARFSVAPGGNLEIPVVLVNQGLVLDTFRLAFQDLPEGWTKIPEPVLRMQPDQIKNAVLTICPPRHPNTRASRYPFRIMVTSQEAPDHPVSIDCTLTVTAFTEFEASLEEPQPEEDKPAKVNLHNLSNIPVTFQVSWSSPDEALAFEPGEPQSMNLANGEENSLEYSVRQARRPLVGGERSYPYQVNIKASDQQEQTLESAWKGKGLLPPWVLITGLLVIGFLCLITVWTQWLSGALRASSATPTPEPTATLSIVDQRPLLIEQKWYLVSYNTTTSSTGVQEPFVLFNPNDTLIGFTGCKDLSGSYQVNFNQLSISSLNLGTGTCPETALQQQEDAMVAILRSARSYFIADTVLQVAGDAGFLNFSLTPLDRAEEITPPQAVIQVVPQAQVGQVVVFDGSTSNGQAPLVTYRWDFGDGASASGVVVQHTYQTAGTFVVRLTVTDQRGQNGTSTVQIHILPLPTSSPTATLPPPTATPVPPTQPPAQPTYTPLPTQEPPTATLEPPPAPVPPQASISGPGKGFVGEPVRFDASASQPGSSPITSFSWSLGNGTNLPPSGESSASAIYTQAGEYEVTVFVQDANGLNSQATTRIVIDARLETDVWTLSTIQSQPLLSGTAITLQFLNGEMAGFAGCNTYTGTYTASLNEDGSYAISLGQVVTSRLSCPQEIMEQEKAYLDLLRQASRAVIQQNRITLDSAAGSLVFYLVEPR
jgi:heat shock protein HslJ